MGSLRMTGKADLKVLFDADRRLYSDEWMAALNITEESFIARYRDCPSVGFENDGIPFGGMILHGNDLHLAILPEFHRKWAILFRPALEWVFSLRSEVYGKVHRPNRQSLRFLRRMGATLVESDDNFLIFNISPEGVVPALRPRQRRVVPCGVS